jgi:hypothetical protein
MFNEEEGNLSSYPTTLSMLEAYSQTGTLLKSKDRHREEAERA